jgi:hypothetical protein
VLGLRARWLQGGKAATDELALLTGDGRTSSRRFPALVHDACWHSGTPVAGLADGRLLLMDMSLATQTALPIPHSSGWGPVTAVSGTADGGLLWAATWASLASYEQLRLRAVHDAPVAPVRTEEILASRRGEVAICRSPYITVAMTAEGRAGEALGCRHALADEEGMLVAQSDRRWQSLWGRSEPTPAEQPPAQFAHVAGGRIATWSGADVAVWERRDGAPWLVAHAKMRETVRQVVAREEGDSFLVVAGAVHELALLPD